MLQSSLVDEKWQDQRRQVRAAHSVQVRPLSTKTFPPWWATASLSKMLNTAISTIYSNGTDAAIMVSSVRVARWVGVLSEGERNGAQLQDLPACKTDLATIVSKDIANQKPSGRVLRDECKEEHRSAWSLLGHREGSTGAKKNGDPRGPDFRKKANETTNDNNRLYATQ